MFSQSLTSPVTTTSVPATQPQIPNDADRRRIIYIQDLYDPDTVNDKDASKYLVGTVGQLVIDVLNKVIYVVSAVADASAKYKPTLEVWDRIGAENEDADYKILGLPGGFQGDAILGIDYSVQPPTARIDGRVWAPGAAYALLYKGDVVGTNGTIISAQYNTSGTLVSNQVPVTLAANDSITNRTIMVTSPFSVTLNSDELPDGSRATVVFYDQGGNPIRNAQALNVQHTALLRDHQLGIKYIESVELVAPWFMNGTSPTDLSIPININFTAAELRAQINYSDGTSNLVLVDGKKCYLLGINQYRPTYVGQKEDLVLVYSLDDGEQAIQADPGSPNQIRTLYTLTASEVNGVYTPKIYTYPYWNGNGWNLKHFLYDLERDVGIDVTQYVTLNESSPVFRPNSYGIEQNMIFNLLLSDVSPEYKAWTQVQYTTIVLYADSAKQGRHWDVRYSYTDAAYVGFNVKSVMNAANQQQLLLGGTLLTVEDWLGRLYSMVKPLVNSYTETAAPTPNFAELLTLNGNKVRFAINDWNKPILLPEVIPEGQTAFIRWLKQDDAGDVLQLGITGITVSANPVNSSGDNPVNPAVIGFIADADFTIDRTEILSGDTFVAKAITRDANGNPIPNVSVSFTPSASYPTTVLSDASGAAVATIELSATGTRTVVAATNQGQTKPLTIQVITPNAIIQDSLITAPTGKNPINTPYTASLVVVDRTGTPIPNDQVTFTITGVNPYSQTVLTDANGKASITVTPKVAGIDVISAKIITGSTAQVTVTSN